LALLITELFLPSFGVLGVGGLVAFILGSLLLFDTSESDLILNPNIVYAAAATFGAFTLVVGYLVVRAHRRRPALGREGLIGEIGMVRQTISAAGADGKIFVHGEYQPLNQSTWASASRSPASTACASLCAAHPSSRKQRGTLLEASRAGRSPCSAQRQQFS
jgi:membrane protein implicated in regulation of membrane protease activity